VGLDAYIDPFWCNLRDTQAQRDRGLTILAIHRAKVGASEVNAENGLGRRQGVAEGKVTVADAQAWCEICPKAQKSTLLQRGRQHCC
jgi:hypothetical protein